MRKFSLDASAKQSDHDSSVSREASEVSQKPITGDDIERLKATDPVFAWLIDLSDATVNGIENTAQERSGRRRGRRPRQTVEGINLQ